MSWNLSIFSDSTKPVKAHVTLAEEILGCEFVERAETGEFVGNCDGIEIVAFREHGFDDDFGIAFSQYDVDLDLEGNGDIEEWVPIAIKIANTVATRLCCKTMAVKNLQRLLWSS